MCELFGAARARFERVELSQEFQTWVTVMFDRLSELASAIPSFSERQIALAKVQTFRDSRVQNWRVIEGGAPSSCSRSVAGLPKGKGKGKGKCKTCASLQRRQNEFGAERAELLQRVAILESQHAACAAELASKESECVELRQRTVELEAQVESARAQPNPEDLGWALASPFARPLHYATFSLRLLTADDAVFKLFSSLVVGSCAPHRANLHSNAFLPAPQLEVLRVEWVTNPRLMDTYVSRAQEVLGLRRSGCAPVPELAHLKIACGSGIVGLTRELNEHFLFHGALPDSLTQICRGGFDPRRGGESVGRMFGYATYFAANSSKSDIYTEDFSQRLPRQAERKLIVARVLIGTAHRTLVPMQDARRPPDGPDGEPLDAVWADTRERNGAVDHVEVMVYERAQAYPQAVVTYRHAPHCQCAECGKRPA